MRSEVQLFLGPPLSARLSGAIAQLGERVLCKHEVVGSIPSGSTSLLLAEPTKASRFKSKVSWPRERSGLFTSLDGLFRSIPIGVGGQCKSQSLTLMRGRAAVTGGSFDAHELS